MIRRINNCARHIESLTEAMTTRNIKRSVHGQIISLIGAL